MKAPLKLFFLILAFWHFASAAWAESVVFGHNLAVTTETPKKGTWSLGSYLASYSPTDHFIIGTSTWMMWGYNSNNIFLRQRWDRENKLIQNVSVQLAYLKSDHYGDDYYRQEVGILWLTGKVEVNPYYRLYLTGNYMYFWDETIPFSLRREPFNDEKYQLSISTLHSLSFTERWSVNLEFGVLGLKARYPQIHSGFSVAYKKASYLIQGGFSVTSTPYNLERLFESSTSARPQNDYYDSSVHPEVQLQWFF